jgi:hypothetical protein
MGGHVRVGLEDNLWLDKGVLAASNAAQVTRVRHIIEGLGLEIATPDEARDILKLKAATRSGSELTDRFDCSETQMTQYRTIVVEKHGAVTLIRLNRPEALNALNSQVLTDLIDAFATYEADNGQRCAVVTGNDKAFAAGADIKEMTNRGFSEMFGENYFGGFDRSSSPHSSWRLLAYRRPFLLMASPQFLPPRSGPSSLWAPRWKPGSSSQRRG